MSYGPPPPRTPYGDQDFIKEDFTSPPAQAPPRAPQPPFANRGYQAGVPPTQPQSPQMAYGQPMMQAGPNPTGQSAVQDFATKMQTLTPEDRIFIRSWRQDSFYYRVLPLAAVGSGALYYYNQMKGLPQKWTRYLMVSCAAYTIGKWSYKAELDRRLAATPLNTPFIQAMREISGVKPLVSSEFSGDTNLDYGGTGSGWNTPEPPFPRAPRPAGGTSPYGQTIPPAYGQYSQLGPQESSYQQPYDSDTSYQGPPGSEPSKSLTSYEELRAKNRGLLQK